MTTIQVSDVSRWFGNVVAINNVSMTIGPGITGLLGPNGAGKSTLIAMMSGFSKPSTGTVTLDGEQIWGHPGIYRKIGIVPEAEAMYDAMTGREFVFTNAQLQGLDAPGEATTAAIAAVEMADAQHRPVGTYSKGMKQRIKMATALIHEPEVLLLDEPFNGMDPRQRIHLMDLLTRLGREGRTVLFSSHILEEVEQIAQTIEVVVAGRHAASGDFRQIRKLMTERPHQYTITSSDNRKLAAALIADGCASGAQLDGDTLDIQASDALAFQLALPQLAKADKIRLLDVEPADESLESVFEYLVTR